MKTRVACVAAVCAIVMLARPPAAASGEPGFRIVPPHETVAGETQAFWAQKWWNWALNIRQEVNPNFELPSATDPTGGMFASIGNDGPIVFLPGAFSSSPIARTLTVPPDRPLLIPILNAEFVAFPTAAPCPAPLTDVVVYL